MILEGLPLLWPGVPDVDVGVHGAGDQELGFKPGPVQIAADTNTSVRPDRVYPLMCAFDLICCYLMTRVCPCREVCVSPQPSLHEYRSTRWLLWGQHAHTEIHTGKHTKPPLSLPTRHYFCCDDFMMNYSGGLTHRGGEDVGVGSVRVPLDRPHVPLTLSPDFPRRFRRQLQVHQVQEATPAARLRQQKVKSCEFKIFNHNKDFFLVF